MLIPLNESNYKLANSYITREDYLQVHENDTIEETTFIMASLIIDNYFIYEGVKNHKEQFLAFPRNKEIVYNDIKLACILIAKQIKENVLFNGIRKEKLGNLEIEYFKSKIGESTIIEKILEKYKRVSIEIK